MMTLEEIAAAEARAKAATKYTPAELEAWSAKLANDYLYKGGEYKDKASTYLHEQAHARTDIPRLAATARTAIEQWDAAVRLLRRSYMPKGTPDDVVLHCIKNLQQDIAAYLDKEVDAFLAQVGKGGA